LEVGVFVAPLLLLFGLLQWRTRGRLLAFLDDHPRLGPLAGALLGAMPGCGGAIVLMPLYLRGGVSFGTIVAALVATMGDSSFVLIAADPRLAVAVHALLLGVGLLVGYLVDVLGVAPRPQLSRGPRRAPARAGPRGAPAHAGPRAVPTPPVRLSTVGAAAAVPVLLGRGPMLAFPRLTLAGFWSLVAVGLIVGVPLVIGVTDGPALAAHLGGVDPVLAVGGVGMVLTAAMFASRRAGVREDPRVGRIRASTARDVLTESARETAFVTVWVAVAFVATAAVTEVTGIGLLAGESGGAALAGRAGLLAVLAGALIGLIPGCGPQILLTGLYVQGALPLSVLAANALSQDGDALFPLLAGNRRAALLGTAVSTIPGVVVGGLLWALGW
jgi:hypothetical protein